MTDAVKLCTCGAEISRFARRCYTCRTQELIDRATKVEPSTPLNIVDTDTFFWDLSEAQEEYAGQWAHPCDSAPLAVNVRRLAADLCERVVEDMCEEAFEDAESQVVGAKELEEAITAALTAFNAAQTSSVWTPRTGEAFRIPASVDTHPKGEDAKQASALLSSAVPKADAQTPSSESSYD